MHTRKHEGTVAVDQINTRWCSDGFVIGPYNDEKVRVAFALTVEERKFSARWLRPRGSTPILLEI